MQVASNGITQEVREERDEAAWAAAQPPQDMPSSPEQRQAHAISNTGEAPARTQQLCQGFGTASSLKGALCSSSCQLPWEGGLATCRYACSLSSQAGALVARKPQVIYGMLPICRCAGGRATAGAPPGGAQSCVSANGPDSPTGCLPHLTTAYFVQLPSLLWTALKQLDNGSALLPIPFDSLHC